jgi:hypothetical protein
MAVDIARALEGEAEGDMGSQVGEGRTAVAGCLGRVRRHLASAASVSLGTLRNGLWAHVLKAFGGETSDRGMATID